MKKYKDWVFIIIYALIGACLGHIWTQSDKITELTQERDKCQMAHAKYWYRHGRTGAMPAFFLQSTPYDTAKWEEMEWEEVE